MTTRQPLGQAGARWALLLRPRWLTWHAFVVVVTVGMLYLGDWQLHRAISGNELSWAYTFEWPLFAAFTVYFWVKSLRDELREHGAAATTAAAESAIRAADTTAVAADSAATAIAPTGATIATGVTGVTGATASADAADARPSAGAGATAGLATGAVATPRAEVGRRAASWDATSWDATNWDATGVAVGADDAGKPVDVARATPADGEAYLARLTAEVQRPSRWRSRR